MFNDFEAQKLKDLLLDNSIVAADGCWEWQRCCGSHGYGQITFKCKGYTTHRVAYELFCGPIPEGIMVCHTCDYRRCINPEHLFLGTADDNSKDMEAKGRDRFDINAKLSCEQVLKIRELCLRDISQASIAKRFEISQATVSRINTKFSYWWF